MGTFELTLKHAGKSYTLPDFDPAAPATVFKDQIYRLTGVPADKVKVPVKGGMLKDDADLNKLGFKPGQTVMASLRARGRPGLACSLTTSFRKRSLQVIGPAGPIPQAPAQPIIFMEDMSEVELAQSVSQCPALERLAPLFADLKYPASSRQAKYPVGLQNLGTFEPRPVPAARVSLIPRIAGVHRQHVLHELDGAGLASDPGAPVCAQQVRKRHVPSVMDSYADAAFTARELRQACPMRSSLGSCATSTSPWSAQRRPSPRFHSSVCVSRRIRSARLAH